MWVRGDWLSLLEGRGLTVADVLSLDHGDVTVTALETSAVVGGNVPSAAQDIVDVLALSTLSLTPASTDAELVPAHEVGPLGDEPWLALVLGVGCGVHDTTDRVGQVVCTVRVHLATGISLWDTNVGEVTRTGDLDVVTGLDEVNTSQSAVRDESSTVSGLSAVSHGLSLEATDVDTSLRRSPDAPVVNTVDPGSLAARVGVPRVLSLETCVVTSLVPLSHARVETL